MQMRLVHLDIIRDHKTKLLFRAATETLDLVFSLSLNCLHKHVKYIATESITTSDN